MVCSIIVPAIEGVQMNLAGALFIRVKPFDEDMTLFVEFINDSLRVSENTSQKLITDKNFSFTLLRENVSVSKRLWQDPRHAIVERTVKIPVSTTLYFFRGDHKSGVDRSRFMFDEDDHCLVVDLVTGHVRQPKNPIGGLIRHNDAYKLLQ
jgi:hypothetical protein